jgi:ketosteroid isomerase-like protein
MNECAQPDADATQPATCSALPTDDEVDDLARRARDGHAALMRGDLNGYRRCLEQSQDFTLMSPFGGRPSRGTEFDEERWQAIARFFEDGRDATLELVHAYRSPGMVVLVAIERAHVQVGTVAAQDWALRVTLVFRKDDDRWIQVHRHADALAGGISVEQAAAMACVPHVGTSSLLAAGK